MSPGASGAIGVLVTAGAAFGWVSCATVGGRRRGRWGVIELLKLAEADGLRLAVFGDHEILGRESFDRLAVLVFHGHGFYH